MNYFYWDASALAKRYTPEVGTPLVNDLFAKVPCNRMMCLHIGTGEVISIFVRKKNRKLITQASFAQAMTDFRAEVLNDVHFELVSTADDLISPSHQFIEKYSLNATDAFILRSALEVATRLRSVKDDLVLIASDQRLLQAAQAEGLATFNPETDSQAQLDTLL